MSVTMVQKWEYKGYRIELHIDGDPWSPDEWGNTDMFLGEVDTRWYRFGKKGASYYRPSPDDEDYNEDDPQGTHYQEGYVAFPVELLDYGSNGCQLLMCDPEDADGAIFVKYRTPLEELAFLRTTEEDAKSVLDEWNTYLSGDVYCVHILKPMPSEDGNEEDDWEMVDSCGGIYGWEEAEKYGEMLVDNLLNREVARESAQAVEVAR